MNIRGWSGARTRELRDGPEPSGRLVEDADVARVAPSLEADVAVDLREQGVVPAPTDVEAGLESRPPLAYQDAATADELATEALDAEHLRIRVATVAGTADALLVRHMDSDLDVGDADRGRRLAMPAITTVILAPSEFHHGDLARPALTNDFAGDARRFEHVSARHDLATVARYQEHRAELDRPARVSGELLDRNDLPRRHAVLLASRCDHGFHRRQVLPFGLVPPRAVTSVGREKFVSHHIGAGGVNFTLGVRKVFGELLAHEEARAVHA